MNLQTDSHDSIVFDIGLDRFRSGQCPSSLEIAHMESFCSASQQDIDCCNAEISKLQDSIFALKQRVQGLQQSARKCRAFCSSIRKIPAEVWVRTFSECIRLCDSLEMGYGDESIISACALSLSQTCSFWRAIMLSTPELWSKLTLNLWSAAHGLEDLVQLYLHRSNTSPLVLDIHTTGGMFPPTGTGFSVFWNLLKASSRWWKLRWDLHWGGGFSDELETYLRSNHVPFDILESLELSSGAGDPSYHNVLPIMLKDTTALRSLVICGFRQQYAESLAYLNTIHLDLTCIQDLVLCFTLCSQLHKASLKVASGFGPLAEDSEHELSRRITHHQLSYLSCSFVYPDDTHTVLSSLVLPALVKLKISIDIPTLVAEDSTVSEHLLPLSLVIEGLKRFISRSSCSLQDLHLGTGFITCGRSAVDQNSMELFILTPKLTRLTIDAYRYSPFSDELFQRLTFSPNLKAFLPSLEHLDVRIDDVPLFKCLDKGNVFVESLPNPELIAEMVSSRRKVGSKAKLESFKLDVTLDPRFEPSAEAWIELFTTNAQPRLLELGADGLELDLKLKTRRWGGFDEEAGFFLDLPRSKLEF